MGKAPSGWHNQSVRHSNAKRFGKAGGRYEHPDKGKQTSSTLEQIYSRKPAKSFNVTDEIIKYEDGQLNDIQTLELFSHLIKTGMAWRLQGSYGRTAAALIDDGFLDRQGNLTPKAKDFMELNA